VLGVRVGPNPPGRLGGRLRKRLAGACREAGLDAPPLLAFERWRFAAKLAEEPLAAPAPPGPAAAVAGASSAAEAGGPASAPRRPPAPKDPVLPGAPAPAADAQLAADLARAGPPPPPARPPRSPSWAGSCAPRRCRAWPT